VLALIVFPYLAIFAYLITQSRGTAERRGQRAQQAREELRHVVGFSVADEIEKLDRLKKSGPSPTRNSFDCAPSWFRNEHLDPFSHSEVAAIGASSPLSIEFTRSFLEN